MIRIADDAPSIDHAIMKKPAPVIVGDLRAVAYRAPTPRTPLWAWRCRKAGRTLWSGRASAADAARALAALLLEQEASAPTVALVETVGQVMDLWYTNEVDGGVDREPATVMAYRGRARRVVRLVGQLRINRGPWVIDELHRHMNALGMSRSTRQSTQTVLCMAWVWAYGHDLIDTAAPPKRRVAQGKAGRKRSIPTLDQALAAIALVAEPQRSVLMVQLATAARISEICFLHVDDVIDTGGRLVLRLGLHVGGRKTGARDVPVTAPSALQALRRSLAEARLAGRALLWQGPRGGALHPRCVQRALRNIVWGSTGGEAFTPHELRHLGVLKMRQAGVPVEQAAALLGHSVNMMLTTYRSIDEDELVEAMERVRLGEHGGIRGLR